MEKGALLLESGGPGVEASTLYLLNGGSRRFITSGGDGRPCIVQTLLIHCKMIVANDVPNAAKTHLAESCFAYGTQTQLIVG